MKPQFTREKMLLNHLLLPPSASLEAPLETNESAPPLRKKGGGSFQKNVIGLSLNVLI